MKIEITVNKSNEKEGYFTASATTSLKKKEKFGINCTPEQIGEQVSNLIKKLDEEISNLNTIIHLLYEFYGVNSKTQEIEMIFEDLLKDKAELKGKTLYLKNWCPYSKIDSVNIEFETGE